VIFARGFAPPHSMTAEAMTHTPKWNRYPEKFSADLSKETTISSSFVLVISSVYLRLFNHIMLQSLSKSKRPIRPEKSKAIPLEVLWRVAVCLPRGAVPCLRPHQGGRLREGGTRACLVVRPALVRGRHGRVVVDVVVVRAKDRHRRPRPAASGARVRGLSLHQPFRVIVAPAD
jgi:hypothetical protein